MRLNIVRMFVLNALRHAEAIVSITKPAGLSNFL